jgi:hypothetical protein
MRRRRAQHRIVGVALIGAAIESFAVGGIERRVEIEPRHEVRVADEGRAEGDQIGVALRNRRVGAVSVEAVIGNDDPAEAALGESLAALSWRRCFSAWS